MRRDYELAFILNPEVSEDQTRGILDRVEQVVANYGGQVVKVNQWGRRRLAYPIEHQRDGLYVFVDMILTPETVIELDRTLKVSEEVLRHFVKRRDPKIVQKEREASVAATAAATALAEVETEKEPLDLDEMQVPSARLEGNGEQGEVAEAEVPPVVDIEDIADIPPAIEETVEP